MRNVARAGGGARAEVRGTGGGRLARHCGTRQARACATPTWRGRHVSMSHAARACRGGCHIFTKRAVPTEVPSLTECGRSRPLPRSDAECGEQDEEDVVNPTRQGRRGRRQSTGRWAPRLRVMMGRAGEEEKGAGMMVPAPSRFPYLLEREHPSRAPAFTKAGPWGVSPLDPPPIPRIRGRPGSRLPECPVAPEPEAREPSQPGPCEPREPGSRHR